MLSALAGPACIILGVMCLYSQYQIRALKQALREERLRNRDLFVAKSGVREQGTQ